MALEADIDKPHINKLVNGPTSLNNLKQKYTIQMSVN